MNGSIIKEVVAIRDNFSAKFHEEFDPFLKEVILHNQAQSDGKIIDNENITSCLYGILAISMGKENAIDNFFKYYDHIINKNKTEEVRVGDGHGSWIGSNKLRCQKTLRVLDKMKAIFEKNPSAFSQENLENWLKSQYYTPEIQIHLKQSNYKFTKSILENFQDLSLQKSSEEVELVDQTKSFIIGNIELLEKLIEKKDDNKYAKYLFEKFITDLEKKEVDPYTNLKNKVYIRYFLTKTIIKIIGFYLLVCWFVGLLVY